MTGARYRPDTVGKDSSYYNILFPNKDLNELRRVADRLKITGAELVRTAVKEFLEENR